MWRESAAHSLFFLSPRLLLCLDSVWHPWAALRSRPMTKFCLSQRTYSCTCPLTLLIVLRGLLITFCWNWLLFCGGAHKHSLVEATLSFLQALCIHFPSFFVGSLVFLIPESFGPCQYSCDRIKITQCL